MSSTSSNIAILDVDETAIVKIGVGSSTTLAAGDLIDASGATTPEAVATSSSANTTFLGIALYGSESGEVFQIAVATRCRINIKVASTSSNLIIGDACKYSAGANGTAWEVTKCTSGSGGTMWAMENITAGNNGEFLVDSHLMKSGFYWDKINEG